MPKANAAIFGGPDEPLSIEEIQLVDKSKGRLARAVVPDRHGEFHRLAGDCSMRRRAEHGDALALG